MLARVVAVIGGHRRAPTIGVCNGELSLAYHPFKRVRMDG